MKPKTVTLWAVVAGPKATRVDWGHVAGWRSVAVRRFLNEQKHLDTWEDARKRGWRVRKITVPWEDLKP